MVNTSTQYTSNDCFAGIAASNTGEISNCFVYAMDFPYYMRWNAIFGSNHGVLNYNLYKSLGPNIRGCYNGDVIENYGAVKGCTIKAGDNVVISNSPTDGNGIFTYKNNTYYADSLIVNLAIDYAEDIPEGYEVRFESSYGKELEKNEDGTYSIKVYGGEVTIFATLHAKYYNLVYIVDDNEYFRTQYLFGSNIRSISTPSKEGYTFSGWSEIPETMPAHDVTVTGTFSINKYKLTYTIDGEEYKSYEVEYGAEITPEEAPTKEGYTFSGWSEIPETMPAHDVVVTGTFTIVDPVTITAKSYSREYGEANPTFEFTSEGAMLTGTPEITCEATATSPVGTYPIVIKKGSVANYNDTYVNGTLTITKAPLAVMAGTYTKKQGEENPEFTLTYDGFKNNETEDVLITKPTVSTPATVESAPGMYPVDVSGGEAQNYYILCFGGTLLVTEADPVTITAKSYTRAYGDANPTFEFSSEGATLTGIPEITCEATASSPVGTYPIVIKKGSVTNYNDTYVNGTLTITKAPLTVTVEDATREQYLENPGFVISYSGWKLNEDESVLTKKPTATTTATKDSPVGEYTIVVSGGEAKNYELNYQNGVLTIIESTGIAEISVISPRVLS